MQKSTTSLVILLGILASVASASTVAHINFSQLSTLAHRVAVGRIERITSRYDTATGRILSTIEIAPARSLPGFPSGSPFSFEMTGGTVGDVRQWIAGFPPLQVGDRVVLFLAEDTASPFGPTIGLWQGVFFVQTDSATGAEFVANHQREPVSEIRGDELVVETGLTRRNAPGGPIYAATPRLTLDAFLQRVSSLRNAARAPAQR